MTAPAERPSTGSFGYEEFATLSPARREDAVRRTPGSAGWSETARIAFMLGRPRTCVPGNLAFALGWAAAGGTVSPAFFLGLFMSLVYGLMANLYNAYTDLAEDSRNLPGRVWLVLRMGHRRTLWIGHAASGTLIVLTLPYGGVQLLPLMLLLLVGAHQYSFRPLRLKDGPVVGLLAFSLAVFGPFLLGAFGAPGGRHDLSGSTWALFGFLVVWFSAKGMVKNLPDFEGDREAGLRTSATVFATRAAAARAATAMTLVGYLSPAVFVAVGLLPPRDLWALVWTVAALVQCRAMARATERARANAVLKVDMLLSTAFLASVLLLHSPGWVPVTGVALGVALLFGSDLLALDSRRRTDVTTPAVP
ncbi:UbiA family prenyltransferase [Streptomyces sp. 71268]|uniref:UbiA family prenyltransferase n=1 Tax=Streptomyces sp. 71268 TaxID=3002640 RepID=UPI0023F673A6|nr:UbiA family prenyltransferase [Streptomyces sp. 71268]WEV28954.1 UbiA family prenyltransferase [Streptomyces sp. 71268]